MRIVAFFSAIAVFCYWQDVDMRNQIILKLLI